MKRLFACLSVVCFAWALVGCGGGGGGGSTGFSINGTVIWLPTMQPPSPQAIVQVDTTTAQTVLSDGSFIIRASSGTSSLLVVYQQTPISTPVSFRFDFPAISQNFDVGDLVIGPEKVDVTGRVLRAADALPIPGALVTLGGRRASTNNMGVFTIEGVAYDSNSLASFFDLEGRVVASNFFLKAFNANAAATGGVVTVDDIFLTDDSGTTPPEPPYTIIGTLSPSGLASGTVVTLLEAGVPIREFTVGANGAYGFWVLPGIYTLQFDNPNNGTSSADQSVTVPNQNTVVRKDATLQ